MANVGLTLRIVPNRCFVRRRIGTRKQLKTKKTSHSSYYRYIFLFFSLFLFSRKNAFHENVVAAEPVEIKQKDRRTSSIKSMERSQSETPFLRTAKHTMHPSMQMQRSFSTVYQNRKNMLTIHLRAAEIPFERSCFFVEEGIELWTTAYHLFSLKTMGKSGAFAAATENQIRVLRFLGLCGLT